MEWFSHYFSAFSLGMITTVEQIKEVYEIHDRFIEGKVSFEEANEQAGKLTWYFPLSLWGEDEELRLEAKEYLAKINELKAK